MTPESFEALLRLLDPDRDQAAVKYEAIRRRLVRLYEWRCGSNAEELADETMDRVARKIFEGTEVRSADPFGFFCGVAHLVFKEISRRVARERGALEKHWPPAPLHDEPEEDDRLACLRRCLDRLPEDQRALVLRYHQEDDHIRSRQMLSQELDVPMNALRIRVHRIRRKLEDCIARCLRAGAAPSRQARR